MKSTDMSPLLDADDISALKSTLKQEESHVIKLPSPVNEAVDLFKRFQHESGNLPREAWRAPTPPRLKVLDELSFLELFRISSLWHDVKRPSDETNANARHARDQEKQWQTFYDGWLQPCLQERWAQRYELVQAGGHLSYRRLFGKHARAGYRGYKDEDDYPPYCDHTTLWSRNGLQPPFAEVLVTQPYAYSLDKMVPFAQKQALWFWISERPAWHLPRGVFFIEWASPESQFASLRSKHDADECMRTIHAWKGEQLLPGPGTVFSLKDPTAVENWRDQLDVNSLTRAELTRLINRRNEDECSSA